MADSTRELAALEAIERDRAEWDAAPSNNRELWQQIGAQERDALRKQLAEQSAALGSAKEIIDRLVNHMMPLRKGAEACYDMDDARNLLAQIEALAGGPTSSASLPSS